MRCLLAVSLILIGSFAAVAAADSKIFPYPLHQTVLDNGLKVITIPFDSPGIVAYYTVVRTGSRNEVEPGLSGFAHFFEHMMFRGTDKYPKDRYAAVLQSIGADDNAFTSDDETVYHTLASSEALEMIMDLQSDRFMKLKYTEEDFKTEAKAILGEYNKNASNPYQTIVEKLREAAYQRHTYKHTTMGFLRDIENMPNQYAYSLKFFERWYRPEHCALVVVGDVQPDKVVALANKYYGSWKRGSFKPDIPQEPPQKGEHTLKVGWKSQTLPVLAIGYHGPAFSDNSIDMPAMDLLSQVLFSEGSNLFRKLVVEEAVVESIEGSQSDSRDPGMFLIFARVKDPKMMAFVKEEILAAIESAKTVLTPAAKLGQIQSFLKYNFATGLNSASAVARIIAHYVQLTGDPETVNKVYALYERASPEDIQAAARKYFNSENRTVVILEMGESPR